MENKLGEFIRLHRERITPQEIGLPLQGRRRTPGLRREELAHLCAVSATWLTWLEQGRPVSASSKALGRLAEALRLTPAERAYLFHLAAKPDPAADNTAAADPGFDAQAVVDAVATPAYILNQRWDAIAWNQPARALFAGWLDEPMEEGIRPNLLAFMFLAPAARTLIEDWEERAQRLTAEFRADCGRHADREPFIGLIASLSGQSNDFLRFWGRQDVLEREGGQRRFRHPEQGELVYCQVTFNLAAARGFKLVMLLPEA